MGKSLEERAWLQSSKRAFWGDKNVKCIDLSVSKMFYIETEIILKVRKMIREALRRIFSDELSKWKQCGLMSWVSETSFLGNVQEFAGVEEKREITKKYAQTTAQLHSSHMLVK